MKKLIHSSNKKDIICSEAVQTQPKLKRTVESGHSYETPVVFNNMDEYKQWWEEDELYED